MIQMTLGQAAALLGKQIDDNLASSEFHGMSIDTRTLEPNNLFIPIKGNHVDGHAFLADAHQKGARAALVTHPIDAQIPQIVVEDTTQALGKLGAAWRDQFDIPFVAVTGSNGKTTLKNMIASILSAASNDNKKVLATLGTLNNHLGLPLTLSRLNANHRYAVIEMGMNHFGEIEYLTKLTRPQVAVITNAAASHLEGVGSLAGVARAKGEIFIGMHEKGTAILNRDDAFYTFWREQIGDRSYLTFGFHPDADVTVTMNEDTQTIHTPNGDVVVKLPLLGKHNILNMLAATAAAVALGIDLDSIKKGLETIEPAKGRLQLHTLANGVNIIDDSYNANPFSLQMALETLAAFSGKKILVLADMKELGLDAKHFHQIAGEKIRDAGIDYLFTYGELSAMTSLTFGEGAYHFSEQEKLITALKPFLYNQTTILIKGSRSMRMENVVTGLIQ